VLAANGGREVASPSREIIWRVGLAGEPAEYSLHRACASAERVVVDVVCKLECCAGVPNTVEALSPREPTVNGRLQRRARPRLAQRLLEQDDRTIVALELCEEEEGLRP
jgi:hypothetical protein